MEDSPKRRAAVAARSLGKRASWRAFVEGDLPGGRPVGIVSRVLSAGVRRPSGGAFFRPAAVAISVARAGVRAEPRGSAPVGCDQTGGALAPVPMAANVSR